MEDRLLETFLELVKIDSETFHEGRVVDFVVRKSRDYGFEAYVDNAGKAVGGEAGNVYVYVPADGVVAPPLLFCSHLDTVSPGRGVEPMVQGKRIISAGKTVLGADCKAGVAVMLELIRLAGEGGFPHGPLEFLFTIAEEKQLQGVRNLEWDRIRSRHAFVLDGSGGVGGIINASPTQDNLEFVFTGRAAHAGVEPEKGINAIYGACWAVSLMRLGRIDSETTANVGIIRGGRAVNIVPERAVVEGEVRSLDHEKLEEQRRSMIRAAMEAEAAVGVGVEVRTERAYEGFRIDPRDPLVLLAEEAGKAMGMRMEVRSSGGGSDANFLNAAGIKSLVLTMGSREAHTTHEYLEIEDLHRLERLCREIAGAAGRLRGK
ncbi:M20/M25/M40 family metallo-hydrolase [Candidatus Solincola sp.]|nr:M20/M25/M40 family metallo-hydrolase [Actinomycetota bacterium]MDI7251355.1 M20/M25/M40 family metallo-hydrolase [Actinomycetota bacterium]